MPGFGIYLKSPWKFINGFLVYYLLAFLIEILESLTTTLGFSCAKYYTSCEKIKKVHE